MLGDTPLSLYLNNADREVVESFTGNYRQRHLSTVSSADCPNWD